MALLLVLLGMTPARPDEEPPAIPAAEPTGAYAADDNDATAIITEVVQSRDR